MRVNACYEDRWSSIINDKARNHVGESFMQQWIELAVDDVIY